MPTLPPPSQTPAKKGTAGQTPPFFVALVTCLAAEVAPEAIDSMIASFPFQPLKRVSSGSRMDVERILSAERFKRYVAAASGDVSLAIEIYQLNIEVSECLFGVLHLAEVCFRNGMHDALTNYIGTPEWFRIGTVLPRTKKPIPYTAPMRNMIAKAVQGAGPACLPGKIVAEITFGFWTNLLSSRFQQALWVPCLHRAFPNLKRHPRVLHRRIESIQRLRNRIAHHERVLTSSIVVYTGSAAQPYLTLAEILECVRWASIDAAAWIEAGTRYRHAEQLLQDFGNRGIIFP